MTDVSTCHQPVEAMTALMTRTNAVQESTNPSPVTAVAKGIPSEVQALYHRWESGEFKIKGISTSQGEFYAGVAHREIGLRFNVLKSGKRTERERALKTLLEIAQVDLHEHCIGDLRRRLDLGKFTNTPGIFGGVHISNLEPALVRALKSAEGGNLESAAKLETFMASLT